METACNHELMEPLSATSQFGHTFGDDLCGFHRGLTQLRILDDLTLDPQTLLLQMIAQGVEFVNQSIDLPEARARNLSKERIGAVRSDLVATFRLLLGLGFRVDASRFAAVPFRLQGTYWFGLIRGLAEWVMLICSLFAAN